MEKLVKFPFLGFECGPIVCFNFFLIYQTMHKAFPVTLSLSHTAPKSDPNQIVWAKQWEADSIWGCKLNTNVRKKKKNHTPSA